VLGQIIGLPLTMFLFAGLGVVLTAASVELTGETISDPINLIGRIDNDFWVIIAMLMIVLATISTNTAANIVSPTNSFQNIAPRFINENRGVMLTGIIGVLLMSWELLKKMGWLDTDVSVESLYSNWLLGYSSLLGPIAGIMIVDYFLIKKQSYNLLALYQDDAGYPAWNKSGLIAFIIPVALTIVAITTGKLGWFYDYGWFTGSILGGLIYYFVARGEIGSSS
jgi:NCS1 family nucleobase:cation symporter-1